MFRGMLPDKLPASDPGNFFVPGPGPAPGTTSAETKNPHRLYAPVLKERSWRFRSDASVNPEIQRSGFPLTPIETEDLPVLPPQIIVGGYASPMIHMRRGHEQAFVPSAGHRPNLVAFSPPILQYASIKAEKRAQQPQDVRRKTIKARAPKAKKD